MVSEGASEAGWPRLHLVAAPVLIPPAPAVAFPRRAVAVARDRAPRAMLLGSIPNMLPGLKCFTSRIWKGANIIECPPHGAPPCFYLRNPYDAVAARVNMYDPSQRPKLGRKGSVFN